MLSRQERLVPQAQNCCNHGNTRNGVQAGRLSGLVASEPFLSLREELPRCLPQPPAVRILFLGNRDSF